MEESGQGYPRERAVPEKRNKKILDEVKLHTYRDMAEILLSIDRELAKGALSTEGFSKYFEPNCKEEKIRAAVQEVLA